MKSIGGKCHCWVLCFTCGPPRNLQSFYTDVEAGLRRSTMSLRISPYLISLVDWTAPETDPIRTQFLPLGSRHEADHPEFALASLGEQAD